MKYLLTIVIFIISILSKADECHPVNHLNEIKSYCNHFSERFCEKARKDQKIKIENLKRSFENQAFESVLQGLPESNKNINFDEMKKNPELISKFRDETFKAAFNTYHENKESFENFGKFVKENMKETIIAQISKSGLSKSEKQKIIEFTQKKIPEIKILFSPYSKEAKELQKQIDEEYEIELQNSNIDFEFEDNDSLDLEDMFYEACGKDGTNRNALYMEKEQHKIIFLCPGDYLLDYDSTQSMDGIYNKMFFTLSHEIGHGFDYGHLINGKKVFAKYLKCLGSHNKDHRHEITADFWGASAMARQINLGNFSKDEMIKSSLELLCFTESGSEHPDGTFRINHIIPTQADLNKALGCKTPKVSCDLNGAQLFFVD